MVGTVRFRRITPTRIVNLPRQITTSIDRAIQRTHDNAIRGVRRVYRAGKKREVQRLVPVRTGKLRRSVRGTIRRGDKYLNYLIKPRLYYARFVPLVGNTNQVQANLRNEYIKQARIAARNV